MTKNLVIENENIENKEVSQEKIPKNLWETISAFSNSDGGDIYFGIDAKNRKVGVNPKYIDSLQRQVFNLCNTAFNHKLYPSITIENHHLIHLHIEPVPATLRPIFVTKIGLPKGGRVRIGSSNAVLDDEWIRRFAIAAMGGAELQEFPGDYKKLFNKQIIINYLKVVKEKRGDIYANLTQREILHKMRAITKNGVTLFGLLAFGNQTALQELTAPTTNVVVTQYFGTTKINPANIDEISLDDREFNGNALNQFNEAFKFIISKLPIHSHTDRSGKRHECLAVPLPAIREALVNAIVHRDYSISGSHIQIDIYSNRIEFSNPGKSLVAITEIEKARPDARNPLLISLFKDWDLAEQRGRGIITIKQSLRLVGLPAPIFVNYSNWFLTTIYKTAFTNDTDHKWLSQFEKMVLNESQLNALIYVKNHSESGINNQIYRHLNNMRKNHDDVRASEDLGKLVNLGILIKIGVSKGSRYFLKDKSQK